jgi:hypothetical protein
LTEQSGSEIENFNKKENTGSRTRGDFISVTATLPVDAEDGTWEMANPCHPF